MHDLPPRAAASGGYAGDRAERRRVGACAVAGAAASCEARISTKCSKFGTPVGGLVAGPRSVGPRTNTRRRSPSMIACAAFFVVASNRQQILGTSASSTYLTLYKDSHASDLYAGGTQSTVPLYASFFNNTCASSRTQVTTPEVALLEKQEHAMLPVILKHTLTVTADVTANTSRKQSLLLINGCVAFYCPLDSVLSIGGRNVVCPTCVSGSTPVFSPDGSVSFSCGLSTSPAAEADKRT